MVLNRTKEISSVKVGRHYYQAYQDNEVYSIYGIPYAHLKMNVAGQPLIFSPPVDYASTSPRPLFDPVDKELDQVSYSNSPEDFPACLQAKSSYPRSAACQYLNLHVPKSAVENTETSLPCLFFIHGGSFMNGSNRSEEINGDYLAANLNIIVAIPNYRIGPLGFCDFSQFDAECTPNNGFRDLCSALRWLQRELASFGGDPNNITIMGESSGGSIVSAFPFVKEAKGLFKRAIILSGIPYAFIEPEESYQRSRDFLSYCEVKQPSELYPPERWPDLNQLIKGFSAEDGIGSGTYTPSTQNDILEANPIALMRRTHQRGEKLQIPLWCSMTKDELAVLTKIPTMAENWGIEGIMDEGIDESDAAWYQALREAYLERMSPAEARSQVITDAMIGIPMEWYAEEASKVTPTYFTRLDWSSAAQKVSNFGAFHTSDLYLLFGNQYAKHGTYFFRGLVTSKQYQEVSQEMQADLKLFMTESHLRGTYGQESLADYSQQDHRIKAYDSPTRMRPVMDPDLRELWKAGHFYKKIINEAAD
ncbi:MAG: carboxylesterase family protein [Eubacteriales bacterium]|nr:carboxylesterase family protein [Eubacteriales bacterium]